MFTSYLVIDNELGDGEDIYRFAMLQGVFTPRFNVIRSTEFSEFVYTAVSKASPCMTGIYLTCHFSANIYGIPKRKRAAGSGTVVSNLDSNVIK